MAEEVEYPVNAVEWVSATFDGVEGVAVFTKEAFEAVQEPKGWKLDQELGHHSSAPAAPPPKEKSTKSKKSSEEG